MKKNSYDIDPASVSPQTAARAQAEEAERAAEVKETRKQSRLAKASFAWTVISMAYAIISGAVLISGKWILTPYSYIMAGLLAVYVVIFIAVVAVAVAVGLYFPIRDYYTAWRTGDLVEVRGKLLLMNGDDPARGLYFVDEETGGEAAHLPAEELRMVTRSGFTMRVPALPPARYRLRATTQCTTSPRPLSQPRTGDSDMTFIINNEG